MVTNYVIDYAEIVMNHGDRSANGIDDRRISGLELEAVRMRLHEHVEREAPRANSNGSIPMHLMFVITNSSAIAIVWHHRIASKRSFSKE